MKAGYVSNDLDALISLTVRSLAHAEQQVQAVIDTGFNGYLTLPPGIVRQLGLRWDHDSPGILADGSEHWFEVYEGIVDWNGTEIQIPINAADGDPLVGMQLLEGSLLTIEVQHGGEVRLQELDIG